MDIVDLQNVYRLDKKEHDEIYFDMVSEITEKCDYSKKCNIIIGHKSSGKSTFSKTIGDGFVPFDKKMIDYQHPFFKDLSNTYPVEYPNIIAPDVISWRNMLLRDIIDKGINFNYETTGHNLDRLTSLIYRLKKNGYEINVYFIAINYIESRLRLYEDYIRGLERGSIKGFFPLGNYLSSFGNIPDIANFLNFKDFESVSFLDSNLVLFNCHVEKDVLVNTLRTLYNDVSQIDFNKRVEFIVNYLARYPEQVIDVDVSSLFRELEFLKYYYENMKRHEDMMILNLKNHVNKVIE